MGQPKQGCAVRQVPIDMCGSGYGSELTRRGGGDHGQRQKRVWEAPIAPQAAQEYIKGKGKAGCVNCRRLPIDLVLIGLHTSSLRVALRKLLRVFVFGGLEEFLYYL